MQGVGICGVLTRMCSVDEAEQREGKFRAAGTGGAAKGWHLREWRRSSGVSVGRGNRSVVEFCLVGHGISLVWI